MKHEMDRNLKRALDSLRQVPPPDKERQAARRADFLNQARQLGKSAVSTGEAVRHKEIGRAHV